ncbi:MAG: hypothetical protein ACI4XL_13025 [Bacillus sp. (in: firmicutes)]
MGQSLTALYQQLSEKREELARLQECERKLHQTHMDFMRNNYLCKEPALSPETWHGLQAKEFEQIREEKIAANYEEIIGAQFNAVFTRLADKITEVELEVNYLINQVSAPGMGETMDTLHL